MKCSMPVLPEFVQTHAERLHFHFSLSCTGEGNGNPLQCSCLEDPRDRGAWWAAVYGVAQSRTRLKRLSSSSSSALWGLLLLLVTLLCPALGDPMDCSPPGSFVHGIFQARLLEWIAIPFSRGFSWCRIRLESPALQADSLPLSHQGSPCLLYAAAAKSLRSCPTLCDPIDSSPPGSAIPGILQARTLEWAAISFSNAWKWKVKVKSHSRIGLLATPSLNPVQLF